MNKWQIICPIVAMAIFAGLVSWTARNSQNRARLRYETYDIGRALLSTTNSARLDEMSPALANAVSSLTRASNVVSEVRLGDIERGDAIFADLRRACSTLVLSNAVGEVITIRLGFGSKPGRYEVLTFSVGSEDGQK